MICAACGQPSVEGARFCASCGTPLDARPDAPGERKQLTVLFADVKGSMDLAERLDAEAWRDVMHRMVGILSRTVERFGGHVDKFTGDGIMALFGAPLAQEDHARRATYAALEMQEEIARYAAEVERLHGVGLAMRIGLSSGDVVAGRIGHAGNAAYTAIGHTVGLAQRMEQLAEAGGTCLTQATAALVDGYVELGDLGTIEVKGSARPQRVFRLDGRGAARSRGELAAAHRAARLVGRERELGVLDAALERALGGDSTVVGVVGEAGVGKSRLCDELADRCRARGIPVFTGRAVSHGRELPFLPVLDLLRGYFGIVADEPPRSAREKVAGRLVVLDEALADELPVVFEFLGIGDHDRPAPVLDPDVRRGRLYGALLRMMQARSEQEPAVMLVEDLHWLDPASDELLGHLVEALPATRTLLVANFRPEYRAPWMDAEHYERLVVRPLSGDAVDALLDDLLGADPSVGEAREAIRERTAGNPFFCEELVQGLAEGGPLHGARGAYRLRAPLSEVTVPPTVHGVLAARIDRLDLRAKGVLQVAAVIGRHFPEPVLRAVAEVASEPELREALRSLSAADLIRPQQVFPHAEYAFKHPLTHEVAYGTLLGERRAALHGAVAVALAQDTERLDERAALIAHHAERAGDALGAARWLRRAALWAGPINPRDAVAHWRRVRSLLGAAPEGTEARALAVEACAQMVNFAWRVGLRDDEQRQVYEAGMALAADDDAARVLLMFRYAGARAFAGDHRHALALSSEARAISDRLGDPELDVAVRFTSYWHYLSGDLREAVRAADWVIEHTRDDVLRGSSALGISPHIWLRMFKGAALLPWVGRAHEAEQELIAAEALAREHDQLETLGWTLGGYASLVWATGGGEGILDRTRESLAIAERLGSPMSTAIALTQLARVLLVVGRGEEGRDAILRGLDVARSSGTGLQVEPLLASQLAHAELLCGDVTAARRAGEEAVAIAVAYGNRYAEALSRLSLGTALGSEPHADLDVAERELRAAIALAGDTGALMIEPIALVSLGQVADARGDAAGAQAARQRAASLFRKYGADARAESLERG